MDTSAQDASAVHAPPHQGGDAEAEMTHLLNEEDEDFVPADGDFAEEDEGDVEELEDEEGLEDEEEIDEEGISAAGTDADLEEEEEEDEEDDEEGDTDEEEEEEEEEEIETYPLPPLPPVLPPPKVHGIATAEVYSIIKELRRQMDDPVEREHARTMLQGDTDVLLAVAQVLQEAGLLRRSTVNEHGEVEVQEVRQPEAPRPSLPTGYNSWIVENPGNARR